MNSQVITSPGESQLSPPIQFILVLNALEGVTAGSLLSDVGLNSFELFKMAMDKLLSLGKTKAVCNVQEDNPNRFLHFALADGKVLEESSCVRRDGSETTDYRLLIDFENLKGISGWQLIKKASRLKKQYNDKKKENELNV